MGWPGKKVCELGVEVLLGLNPWAGAGLVGKRFGGQRGDDPVFIRFATSVGFRIHLKPCFPCRGHCPMRPSETGHRPSSSESVC